MAGGDGLRSKPLTADAAAPHLLGANGVLVAGPSPHTRMVACSSLAPSKCTPLARWVTKLPAGIGTVAPGSNLGPEPTHQVPDTTMKKRSLGWKCGRLMLPGSHCRSTA